MSKAILPVNKDCKMNNLLMIKKIINICVSTSNLSSVNITLNVNLKKINKGK